jgi:hypothetical protein
VKTGTKEDIVERNKIVHCPDISNTEGCHTGRKVKKQWEEEEEQNK